MKYDFLGDDNRGQVELTIGRVTKTVTVQLYGHDMFRVLEPVFARFPSGTKRHIVDRPFVALVKGEWRWTRQMVYAVGKNNASVVAWVN